MYNIRSHYQINVTNIKPKQQERLLDNYLLLVEWCCTYVDTSVHICVSSNFIQIQIICNLPVDRKTSKKLLIYPVEFCPANMLAIVHIIRRTWCKWWQYFLSFFLSHWNNTFDFHAYMIHLVTHFYWNFNISLAVSLHKSIVHRVQKIVTLWS